MPAEQPADQPASRQSAARARLGVIIIFICHSLPRTSWTPFIPLIKHSMGIDNATLGTALLGAPAGSFLAMLVIGPLLPRFGSHRSTAVTFGGYVLTGVALGLARTPLELFLALFCWGLFQGSLDVTMNAQGVTVERAGVRPVMSGFHAAASIGGFVGVVLGAGSIVLGLPLVTHMIALSAAMAVAGLIAVPRLLDDRDPTAERAGQRDEPSSTEQPRRRFATFRVLANRTVLVLGLLTLTSMLCEGAMADWSAVYLRETVGVQASTAALGFAAYSATMVSFRLAGDRLLYRWDARKLLPPLTLIAAAGATLAIALPGPISTVVGFGLLGVGTALVVPATFSAAGRLKDIPTGPAVAAVAALGWMGYVLGPPLIGHLANLLSLQAALIIVPLLMLTTAIVSRRCRAL